MGARDDYPLLGVSASLSPCTNACHHDHCARWRQTRAALDEIDVLRARVKHLAEGLRHLGVSP